MSIFSQQATLPLRPQPDHATKSYQAADQRIDKTGNNKLVAIQCKQLERIDRGEGKTDHRPAVAFADNQIAHQGDDQHRGEREAFGYVVVQRRAGNDQPGHGACRPVQDAHACRPITVLRNKHHRHHDPVRFRQMERAAHQAGNTEHDANACRIT